MSTRWLGSTDSLPDSTFIVLAFSVGGGALMSTWLSMVHASLRGWLVATIPWVFLALLSVLRTRRAAPSGGDVARVRVKPRFIIADIGWATVPLAAGGIIGVLVAAGSSVLLGVFAAACSFAPWRRMPLCRQHPGRAALSMCGGGALALVLRRADVHPMFLPIAAWILGICGLAACVGTMHRETPSKPPGRVPQFQD